MATRIYAVPARRPAPHTVRLTRTGSLSWASELALRVANAVATWVERAKSRRELRSLDDRILKDVGISRVDVEREARKRFWQL